MTLSIRPLDRSRPMHSLLNVGVLAVAGSALLLAPVPAAAQTSLSETGAGFKTGNDRNILDTTSGSKSEGSVLDATNPMQLMQRLRQATSLNDATDPVDAIDAALRAFEEPDPAAGTRP